LVNVFICPSETVLNGSRFDETILVDMYERDDLYLKPVGHLLWTPPLATNIGASLGVHVSPTVAKTWFVRKVRVRERF
jgi:hypothetical protein